MSNARVKSTGWSTGEKFTAAQATALDLGQYYAFTRTGVSALLGATTIQGGGFAFSLDFSDNAASQGAILLGDQDFLFQTSGIGVFSVPADKWRFSGTSWPVLGTRTITDFSPDIAFISDEADWKSNGGGSGGVETTGTSATSCSILLNGLPKGMVITSVKVEVKGVTGGSLPGVMPTATLYRYGVGAYNIPSATVGSQTDASADNAAFTADHTITITGLSHTVLNNSQYQVNVTSPTGGGVAAGFKIYRVFVTGTLATLRTA
jgi:hypothetical protein